MEKFSINNQFNHHAPNQAECSNCETNTLLGPSQGVAPYSDTTKLNKYNLNNKRDSQDEKEHPVIKEANKYI